MLNRLDNAKIIFLMITFFVNSCSPVVILVHGSFSVQASWSRPYGDFYQVLDQQVREQGQTLFSFCWSGQPTVHEIFLGAVRLANLIESYPEDESIILIGHSHGGNVINLASRFLYDPGNMMPEEIEQKWQKILEGVEASDCVEDQKNSEILDITPAENVGLSVCATTRILRRYRIKQVFLLGTPIDVVRYKPEMEVIEALYNLYSLGDHVQTVGGMYDRTFPEGSERICNLRVQFKKSGILGSDDPTHSALRDPVVAQWILQVPEILNDKNCALFQDQLFLER